MLLRRRPNLRRQPQQERSAVTVAAIIEAAGRLLIDQGPEQLKMTELAVLAGVSPGTLYQYFPDRPALLGALVDRVCEGVRERFEATLQKHAGAPLDELLDALATGGATAAFRHRALKAAAHQQFLQLAAAGELIDGSEDYATKLAAALAARLNGTAADHLPIARAMVWACDGILDGAVRADSQVTAEEAAKRIRGAWKGLLATDHIDRHR